MTKPVRVLLVENHMLVRAGVASLLRNLPNVAVVDQAADGLEALNLIKESRPTLVVTDIAMPNLNGMEMLARITKEYPGVRVLMLSMYADEEHVRHALQLGAAGFLSKDSTPAELAMAIKVVSQGKIYLSPKITSVMLNDYLRRLQGRNPKSVPQGRAPLTHLTPRQREVLQLVAEGRSTKEIATLLKMKVKTVEVHRAQLMKRLDIHDTAGLVRYAVRYGIVTLE
jgi:DNA-binding NarL/FixJ family response regulator